MRIRNQKVFRNAFQEDSSASLSRLESKRGQQHHNPSAYFSPNNPLEKIAELRRYYVIPTPTAKHCYAANRVTRFGYLSSLE
jgi:hypothetical protein